MDSRPLTSMASRPTTRGGMGSRQKAYSAPVPLELGKEEGEPETMEIGGNVIELDPRAAGK